MGGPIGRDLLALFDHAFGRAERRLVGLTDEEYGWEPVPGAAAIGSDLPGTHVDRAVVPVTTIAWRLCHVSDAIARHPMNGFLQQGFTPSRAELPESAAEGIDYFGRSCGEWRRILEGADEDAWLAPLGPAAGPFADSTMLAVALHNADEFVHHTAEIALLRDLYAHRAGA